MPNHDLNMAETMRAGTDPSPAYMCPRCGHTEFLATAIVEQLWRISADGVFMDCANECEQVVKEPGCDDTWTCGKCGYEAEGRAFALAAADKRKD